MEDGKVLQEEKNEVASGRRKRSWLRIPIYMLAGIGAFVIAIAVYMEVKREPVTELAERITIDEAATIEDVMTQTYGKYSESKRGWLYVGPDDRTYVMKVIQQAKQPGGPAGEE